MEWLDQIFHLLQDPQDQLNLWAGAMGPWLYVVLFAIVFAEPGFVVTPFLPGDSLLFAVGALAVTEGSPIDLVFVGVALSVAAVLGDAVNYTVGHRLGPRVFSREDSKLLNKKHLLRAQEFYERYGGKTIVIARFVPIVRTFAPFVAGVGLIGYGRFALFNVVGGLAWVWSFLLLGAWFGEYIGKDQFHLVIAAIIVLSCIPPVFEWWRARRRGRAEREAAAASVDAADRAAQPPQGAPARPEVEAVDVRE